MLNDLELYMMVQNGVENINIRTENSEVHINNYPDRGLLTLLLAHIERTSWFYGSFKSLSHNYKGSRLLTIFGSAFKHPSGKDV